MPQDGVMPTYNIEYGNFFWFCENCKRKGYLEFTDQIKATKEHSHISPECKGLIKIAKEKEIEKTNFEVFSEFLYWYE